MKCVFCESLFTDRSVLLRHVESHIFREITVGTIGNNSAICYCGEAFPLWLEWASHLVDIEGRAWDTHRAAVLLGAETEFAPYGDLDNWDGRGHPIRSELSGCPTCNPRGPCRWGDSHSCGCRKVEVCNK